MCARGTRPATVWRASVDLTLKEPLNLDGEDKGKNVSFFYSQPRGTQVVALGLCAWIAVEAVQRLLAPSDVEIATEVARRAAGRADLGYAIWVLERVREFRPDLGVDYHVALAWLYITADRMGDARLEAELARVMDPESAGVKELWEHLGS